MVFTTAFLVASISISDPSPPLSTQTSAPAAATLFVVVRRPAASAPPRVARPTGTDATTPLSLGSIWNARPIFDRAREYEPPPAWGGTPIAQMPVAEAPRADANGACPKAPRGIVALTAL